MNPWAAVPDHVMLALGWTLLHFLWQGALVAALLAIASRAFDRNASAPRYVLATGALLVMAALPVATFFRLSAQFADHPETAVIQTTRDSEWNLAAATAQAPKAGETGDWSFEATETSPGRAASTRVSPATSPDMLDLDLIASGPAKIVVLDQGATLRFMTVSPPPAPEISLWQATRATALTASRMLLAAVSRGLEAGVPLWLPWLVALWGLGVSLLTLRLIGGWVVTQRIKRAVIDDPTRRLQQTVVRLAERLGVSRTVRVFRSALVESPTVIGWLRPVILVPLSAVAGLTPAQMEALLAHELAHIRRHDYLVNLLQAVVETLLFYHPAVWWVSRVIRNEREHCCDDLAVAVCGDRVAYARALCELERLRMPAPAMAMAATGGPLLQRIRRLLEPAPRASLASRCGACLVVLGSLLLVVAVLAPAVGGARERHAAEDGLWSLVASFVPEAPAAPDTPRAPRARAPETPAPPEVAPTPAPDPPTPLLHWHGPMSEPHVAPMPMPPLMMPGTPAPAPAPSAEPWPVPVAPLPRAPQVPSVPGIAPRAMPAPLPTPMPSAAPIVATRAAGGWLVAGQQLMEHTQREVQRAVQHMMHKDMATASATATAGQPYAMTWTYQTHETERAEQRAQREAAVRERQIREAMRLAADGRLDEKDVAALLAQRAGADYVRQMTELLGETPDGEDLLAMYLMGVTPDYVRQMADAMGDMPDAEEIAGLRVMSVTPDYVRTMRDALGDDTGAEELAGMKAQGVTPEYVREMRAALDASLDADEMIGLKIHGVTPQYVKDIAASTGHRYEAEELVALKSQSVNPDYVREITVHAGRPLEAEELIELKSRNVTPRQMAALKGLGLEPGTEGMVELMSHGISLGDAAQMRRLRGHDLSLDQLYALHDAGVTPEVVGAMNVLGYRDLSDDDLIELANGGLSVELVAQYTSAFGRTLTKDELLLLQNHGVGVIYAGNMAHLPGTDFSVEDIVELYNHGVPSAWISAVLATGYRHTSVDDLILMTDRGVSSRQVAALMKAGRGSLEPEEISVLADHGIGAERVKQLEAEAGRRLSVPEIVERCTGEGDCKTKAKSKKH